MIGGVIAVVLLVGYAGSMRLLLGWGGVLDAFVGMSLAAIGATLISLGVLLGFWIVGKLPRRLTSVLFGSWFALTFLIGMSPGTTGWMTVGYVIVAAIIGGCLVVLRGPEFSSSGSPKKAGIGSLLTACVAGSVWFFVWVVGQGTEEGLLDVDDSTFQTIEALEAPDPSQVGSYTVQTLTYGRGEDRRPQFGESADLITESVNGKAFLNKPSGFMSSFRDKYWGFGRSDLSINGTVWYPEGKGPFPLVLIVHGNHLMRDYSDPGYAYLGELMASRGYIFVSVDENFLNGDWAKSYSKENDARGWLMLQHLQVWRDWSTEDGHVFEGRVDMDNISLIGHSRGGEAVGIAAAFNTLTHYPDDARVEFDFDFNIRSIVAIAPVDGQYLPSDVSTPLRDMNYLLLHGAHDTDVSRMSGDKLYKRISFSGDEYAFKTSIYIYRSNHGQFNTTWGNTDWGFPGSLFINKKALLSGEDQRQIAKTYISSFLDTTLKGDSSYMSLYRDYRSGMEWLPETYYISRFEDSQTRFVSDYHEDVDVTTATLEDATHSGSALATWREEELDFRGGGGRRQNQVVILGWDSTPTDDSLAVEEKVEGAGDAAVEDSALVGDSAAVEVASYSLTLPENLGTAWDIDANTSFTFSIAESTDDPGKPEDLLPDEDDDNEEEEENESSEENENDDGNNDEEDDDKEDDEEEDKDDEDEPRKPLEFTVELADREGQIASLPLSDLINFMPPMEAKLMRTDAFEDLFDASSEPILQTVDVKLSRFVTANPEFVPAGLETIRFIFDRSEKGVIILDEIGFRSE